MADTVHACPICHGAKLVSRPPGVAGDLPSGVASGTEVYPCQTCGGKGYIIVKGRKP